MTGYAWIIDRDHLYEEDKNWVNNPDRLKNEAGITGPHDAPEHLLAILRYPDEGTKWRAYDDDGIRYYSGRIVVEGGPYDGDEILEGPEEAFFGPLWDYCEPGSGCTYLKYKNNEGKWTFL